MIYITMMDNSRYLGNFPREMIYFVLFSKRVYQSRKYKQSLSTRHLHPCKSADGECACAFKLWRHRRKGKSIINDMAQIDVGCLHVYSLIFSMDTLKKKLVLEKLPELLLPFSILQLGQI